jgi:hypothetical protein
MLGFNGGLLGVERRLTSGRLAATGLWLPNEQSVAKRVNNWPFGPTEVPNIGDAFLGGFFAGYISHTANGVATHALIVAPRATGASGTGYPLTTGYAWKTTGTTTTGATSTFDGRANTDAMIAAGISLHPAAQFCVNLTIGGFTDWYLPARYELAIAYTNLKPTTGSNSTSVGINDYSVPIRASNYTTSSPAISSVAAFQSPSGTERFETAGPHSTSAESSATLYFQTSFADGSVPTATKTATTTRTRAFRRVPV